MEFNCLKTTEPLQENSSLFTIQFPRFPGTQYYGKIKNLRSHSPKIEKELKNVRIWSFFEILIHNNFRQKIAINMKFFASSMLGILQLNQRT